MSIIKVCILTPFYLPSYKGGGPIKSVKNIVESLKDSSVKFYIICNDRDLGDLKSFDGQVLNEWVDVGGGKVFYLEKGALSFYRLAKAIKSLDFDILYLNSFFSPLFSLVPFLMWRFNFLKKRLKLILAPRGEFSEGALKLKSGKKTIYINFLKFLGIRNSVIYHATSDSELNDIHTVIGRKNIDVCVASNLPDKVNINSFETIDLSSFDSKFKLVFLSRISPKKNLDYALRVLALVKNEVEFDIYGPKEDKSYWQTCVKLIESLPNHISVNYCGSVKPEEVSAVFSKYDLFFFPTHGENYGHVIAESLSVGTPVLLSNQTPWRNLEVDQLGWDLSLDSIKYFVEKIEAMANLTLEERKSVRRIVLKNGFRRVNCEADIKATRRLFEFAMERLQKG